MYDDTIGSAPIVTPGESSPPPSLINRTFECPDGSSIVFRCLIGKGATGAVYRCEKTDAESGQMVQLAAKVVDVRRMMLYPTFHRERDKLKREVAILASISHTGVVNLHGVIDTSDMLVLLMDLVPGGELFNKVLEAGAFNECQARYVFIQIAQTLSFLHGEGVIHRDLKLENVLVEEERLSGFYQVKVADFGLSKLLTSGFTQARSYVGTPQYWAPEVIQASRVGSCYSFEADIWSLGCLLYVLIAGTYPFNNEQEVLDGTFHLRYQRFAAVSSDCLTLIGRMLVVDPAKRITLSEILDSPWCTAPWPSNVPALPEQKQTARKPIVMNVGPIIVGAKSTGSNLKAIVPATAPPLQPRTKLNPPHTHTPSSQFDQTVLRLFDAKRMLELVAGVFYRFHKASLLFRGDVKLQKEFHDMLQDMRDLVLDTEKVFRKFQITCHSVLETLEDTRSVVAEGRPDAALSILESLKVWIKETLENGTEMRQKFTVYTKRASDLVLYTREKGINDFRPPVQPQSLVGPTAHTALPAPNRCLALADYSNHQWCDEGRQRAADAYDKERTRIFDQVSLMPIRREECEDESSQLVAKRLLDFLFVPSEVVSNVCHDCTDGTNRTEEMWNRIQPPVDSPMNGEIESPTQEEEEETIDTEAARGGFIADKAQVLIGGLQELQKINFILEQCTAFWDNMDVTLSLVTKFKDQATVLLQIRDNDRFLDRLQRYENFWHQLGEQCDLFVAESTKQAVLMRKFVDAFNESMIRAQLPPQEVSKQ